METALLTGIFHDSHAFFLLGKQGVYILKIHYNVSMHQPDKSFQKSFNFEKRVK